MRRGTLLELLAFILCIACAEGLARVAFEFPLYDADDEVGYWPRPDQQGSFLFVNDWAFDNNSLGVSADFQPTPTLDVLLVGDSIVYGGNEFRQADKLDRCYSGKLVGRSGPQAPAAGRCRTNSPS